MSVRIKAIAGEEDQGGGIAWRLNDNNNYYITRLNPLENNLRLYKIVHGSRKRRIFKIDSRAIMLTFAYTFNSAFKENLMENKFKNE